MVSVLRYFFMFCLIYLYFGSGVPVFAKNIKTHSFDIFADGGYSAAESAAGFYSGYNVGSTALFSLVSGSVFSFMAGGGVSYEMLFYKFENSHAGSLDTTDVSEKIRFNLSSRLSHLFAMGQVGLRISPNPSWTLYTLASVGNSSDFTSQAILTNSTYIRTQPAVGTPDANTSTTTSTKKTPSKKVGGIFRDMYSVNKAWSIGWQVGLYSENIGGDYYKNLNTDLVVNYGF